MNNYPTSKEFIKYGILFLQELHNKETLLEKTEGSLENYKRKFAVVRHQQGLLYQEYLKAKQVNGSLVHGCQAPRF